MERQFVCVVHNSYRFLLINWDLTTWYYAFIWAPEWARARQKLFHLMNSICCIDLLLYRTFKRLPTYNVFSLMLCSCIFDVKNLILSLFLSLARVNVSFFFSLFLLSSLYCVHLHKRRTSFLSIEYRIVAFFFMC